MTTATTAATTSLSRIMMAGALALILGLMLAQGAAAKPAKGVSVSDREQSQKDLCDVSGGTFGSRDYYGSYTNGHQFIKNVTTCTGGKNPQTCTNTKNDTTCTATLVVQPKGPLDGITVDEGQISGIDPGPAPQDPLGGVTVDESQIGGVQVSDPAPLDPIPTDGAITVPVRTSRAIPDGSNLSPIDPLP
jgi:hypothetical protein